MTAQNHPYYPPSASIDDYAPNVTPLWILAGSFSGIIGAVLGVGLVLARSMRRAVGGGTMGWGDQFGICWFLLCEFCISLFNGLLFVELTRGCNLVFFCLRGGRMVDVRGKELSLNVKKTWTDTLVWIVGGFLHFFFEGESLFFRLCSRILEA